MTVREFVLGSKLRLIMLICIVLINHNIIGIIVTAVIMAFLIPLVTALINRFINFFELFNTSESKIATWFVGIMLVLYTIYIFNLSKVIMLIFSIIVAIITGIYLGIKNL